MRCAAKVADMCPACCRAAAYIEAVQNAPKSSGRISLTPLLHQYEAKIDYTLRRAIGSYGIARCRHQHSFDTQRFGFQVYDF